MAMPGLSREQVQKASVALLKFLGKQQEESASLLDDDELIYINIALTKVPTKARSDKPIRLAIPHPIYAGEGIEVCLIVKDLKGEGHKAGKAKVKADAIPGVTKVVGVSKLRSKYESHEAKRKLCASYDLFMADERVLPSLPKLIGRTFFRKKKQPLPVQLTGGDWADQVARARAATHFFWTGGSSLSIRIARASQTPEQVVENVLAALEAALPHIPKKWAGVKAVYLKSADSVALPVFQASLEEETLRIKA